MTGDARRRIGTADSPMGLQVLLDDKQRHIESVLEEVVEIVEYWSDYGHAATTLKCAARVRKHLDDIEERVAQARAECEDVILERRQSDAVWEASQRIIERAEDRAGLPGQWARRGGNGQAAIERIEAKD